MSNDEQTLSTFYNALSNMIQFHNLRSLRDFFTLSESSNIENSEFRKGLLKLGYEENTSPFEFLVKKYQNFYAKNLINLNIIIEEYETFLSNRKKQSTNNPGINYVKSNETETSSLKNNITKNPTSGFVINSNSRNDQSDTQNGFMSSNTDEPNFGVTKYLNTTSNLGVTQEKEFGNVTKTTNNISNLTNDNFSRRTKQISFREEEMQPTENSIKNNSQETGISPKNSSSRPPTFGETRKETNNSISEKLEKLNQKMISELNENLSFIKITLYEKFYNFYNAHKGEMEAELLKNNRQGFLKHEQFEDFIDSCLVLEDKQKKILMMDIVRDNAGNYSANDFLDKIKSFDKNEIISHIRNYNLNYNEYIVTLRETIKNKKMNLKNMWIDAFQSVPKTGCNGFIEFVKKIGTSFTLEEYEYIFEKISEDGKYVMFKNFENIINRNPPSRESVATSQLELLNSQTNVVTSSVIDNKHNSYTTANFNSNNSISGSLNQETANLKEFVPNTTSNFNNMNTALSNSTTNIINRKSVRSENLFSEIKNISTQESISIILQRLQQVDQDIIGIISNMQIYQTYKIYENLTRLLKPIGHIVETYFMQKDFRQGYLTDVEFTMVLASLNIKLEDRQMELIFQSINNKQNNLYFYKEFLTKVFNYTGSEIYELHRKANQFYNPFIVEFRSFLKENKLDINVEIKKTLGKIEILNFDQFVMLLKSIQFQLSHIQEYKYMFAIFSQDNATLNAISFIDLIALNPPDINTFIESGKFSSQEKLAASIWKNKLIKFTDEQAKVYQKKYQHFFNTFKAINSKLQQLNPPLDLVAYYETSGITGDGELDQNQYIKLMNKLGIVRDAYFVNLFQTFSNSKNDMYNIVGFLNAYNSFFYQSNRSEIKEEEVSTKNKKDDKPPVKVTGQSVQPISPPIVTENTKSNMNTNNTNKFVETNYKRGFTQEDIETVDSLINLLSEIILEEKGVNILDLFKSKLRNNNNYFTRKEFVAILYEDLEVDTESEKSTFEILYDYLISDNLEENTKLGFEPIKLDKIILTFKKFSELGIEVKKSTQTTTLQNKSTANSREEKIMKEFSHFLNNNRIKFSQVFPQFEGSNSYVQIYDVKQAFLLSGFQIAHDDLEVVIKYLDPYNKSYIQLETIKNIIKIYEPEYFNKPFQKIEQNKVSQQHNSNKFSHIFGIINDYISSRNLSIEEFFANFDKDADAKISKTEFIQKMLNIDQKFTIEKMVDVFHYIDKDNTNYITINKFYGLFQSADLTSQERKEKIKISGRMMSEINYLFEHFDKDKDNLISKDDFYKALKSINNRTTMDDVNAIMLRVDKDKNGYVDKKEFTSIMEENIRNQIVMKEEEKEYVIRLFKEEDIDKVNYLTPVQMKHLLTEKLECDMTDKEMEELINKVDVNNDGMIDIDEFIKLLNSVDNSESLKHTVRQINLKRTINPMTFLSIFDGLPMNFIPSFIKEEQKLYRLLPSSTLRPRTDATGILFDDILPGLNPINSNNIGKSNFSQVGQIPLRPISTQINAILSFQTATGVVIPDENILSRENNIVGRILKVALFNSSKNAFIGNSINIEATWKKKYEDQWHFEEDKKMFNNNIIIRYNEKNYESISIIIEFVILIKKENIVTETSCGWSEISLKEFVKPCELKLQIVGGCPIKKEDISKSDVRTKRSGWAKFTQLFKGEVKSQLPVKIKPLKDLNNQDKALIDYLPSMTIIHRASLQMCVSYRKYIAKHILNNQFYSLKVIKTQNSFINNFCKIVDCPDSYRPMIELWNIIVVDNASANEKKDDLFWENNLLDFVSRVYNVIYSEKFAYDEIDPTKLALGIANLDVTRNLLINSAIKFDKGKKINKNAIVEPLENLTSFKPFSIHECIGKKIDIISKLDEILPYNERSVSYDLNRSGYEMTR